MKQRQYNLDKTAYDLEKTKRFIWKFYISILPFIFFAQFKEIYIMCIGIIGYWKFTGI